MKFKVLGDNGPRVSEVCLGTMTWGEQNTMAEAHAQLDFAVAQGVDFIDTAEMYPVPGRAETQGRTEEYLGHWLARQQRDKLVVATKVAGPHRPFKWIRGGPPALDRANIQAALDGSLKRLQTDYVDLYQIHWPERNVPVFGAYAFDPAKERDGVSIEEQLAVLSDLVRAGKVRYIGLSNETPWGVMAFLRAAEKANLPRVVSIQNAYSLVNRTFEYGLGEVCFREKVSLLPYSILAFGHLTAKYLDPRTASGRISKFAGFGQRYEKPGLWPAVEAYAALARKAGMTPAALAQAFVGSRWFVGSTIVGATSLDQLAENIAAAQRTLPSDILDEIDRIHLRHQNPAP
jgi:aryl-alcohol dehydrogenase-like predicted oxidoreductase